MSLSQSEPAISPFSLYPLGTHMNAIASPIRTAATLPATLQTASNQRNVSIALNSLFLSPENVRKVEPTGIFELARTILAQGLLNPLIVTEATNADGASMFAVEAGGRRLRALQMLASEGLIAHDLPIECKLIDAASALEISLTENSNIEGMHPSDEFEAYFALSEKGMPVASIANKFGVTEIHVQRRLKLAGVAPELFALYRENVMSLDQLTAFAATDDLAVQVSVWNTLPTYSRSAHCIKNQIFQKEVTANDKRLKIVSLADYKAAGGLVRVDLFSEDCEEIITNPTLLDELVAKRLEERGAELLAEGWGWVDVRHEPVYIYNLGAKYLQSVPVARTPTDTETAQLAALEAKHGEINDQITALEEGDEEGSDEYDELHDKANTIDGEIDELKETFFDTSFSDKANMGVIVYPAHGGIEHHYGLRKNGQAVAGSTATGTGSGTKVKAEFSEKVMLNLTSHKTIALQASLIANPDVALAAAAHRFAYALFERSGGFDHPVKISLTLTQHELKGHSDSITASKGFEKTQQALDKWTQALPADKATWLDWFIAQPTATSLEMIVLGTALTTTAVHSGNGTSKGHANGLVKAVNLDMASWWEATPATFLNAMPKSKLIEAVTEATSEADALPIAKMKKGEAVTYAASKLAGTNWLPSALRA